MVIGNWGGVSKWVNSFRWRTRLTLWLAAVLAACVVVGFARLAELCLAGFFTLTERYAWLPFLLTPAVGMLAVWLTRRFFPGAQGSGIPQVIAARRLSAAGQVVGHLVSLRIACGKVLVGSLALLGGFSSGREGPSVQIAASILHAAHRWLPHTRALRASDLILAGGAAGIAAAFNTPLAGIVFAIEELGRRLETRTSGVLISTIIISGMVAIALEGNYNYFGLLKVVPQSAAIILPALFAGLLCGLLGGLFSRCMLWPQTHADWGVWAWRKAYPIRFAGLCGLAVATLGFLGGGFSFGSGYAITNAVVSGQLELPWHAAPARYLATLLSYFSGIPGGIFAPSLAIGGALGSSLHALFGEIGQGALIALFMAGFLSAVTQSPLTSAIIVMEMIDGHEMVISLIGVAFLAKLVSARWSPELYQQLALDWMPVKGSYQPASSPASR